LLADGRMYLKTLGKSATEAHLRSILATIPDALIIIDEMGMILSFSAAAEKLFGYAEEEVVGENVSMLMPSPDRERHDGYLKNYRDTGVRKIIGIGRVTTARHRDGNTFPIELSVGEAKFDGRRVFTGFIHDITQRQQAELRFHELQSELAHVGRLSELGTLASSLAHELNQPLTAIASYCDGAASLLEGTPDSEQLEMAREALRDTAEQAIRAGEIVRRMRDFLSHGETEHRDESLSRIITEANALALVGTREHGIDVQISLDPKAERVFVDRIQIQQVVINLIRNAIEAMLDSPVRSLAISTEGGPELITVSVEDTGSGISETLAPQLFQPFVTSKQSGMGIGLSICRTIIESHGGRIWFEPGPEGGTIFRFTLPRAEVEE
jgi:two-component system sensor kinase FixL